MFSLFNKFSGLVLSAFIGVTPISFDWDLWQFPQTRTVTAHWATEFYVQDLGYKDSPTGISVNTIDEEDAVHYYVVLYIFNIECSEACYVSSGQDALSISDTSFVITSKQAYEMKASELFAIRNFTQNGANRANLTFSSASDTQQMQLQMPVMNNSTVNVNVWFKGATEGVMLDDIANHTLNASSYLLRLVLQSGDFDSTTYSTIQTYINNNDYQGAWSTIQNYYSTHGTDQNDNIQYQIDQLEYDWDDFNYRLTDITTLEDTQIADFKQQFSNINLQFDNSKFTSSGSFYKKVFTDFVASNEIFTPILVTLFIIIASILLGVF